MSHEAAEKFLAKVQKDEALERQGAEALSRSADKAAALAELGQKHGYRFTGRELEEVLSGAGAPDDGELGDDDLDMVVGGVGRMMRKRSHWPRSWGSLSLAIASGGDRQEMPEEEEPPLQLLLR